MKEIAALVLAAGQSRRMGRPKMILPWGSTTVIGQVVGALVEGGVPDILVVTGAASQQVQAALQGQPVRFAHNPDYASGEMLSTCQTGLAALHPDTLAALIVLGDQPQIQTGVVQSVIEAYTASLAPLVVPSYQKHRGHPWLVDKTLWPAIQSLRAPATLRDFLNTYSSQILYIELESPTILQDLDTPDDYERYNNSL